MATTRRGEAPIGATEAPDLADGEERTIDADGLAADRELEGVALAPSALDDADLREARLTGLDLGEARLREVRFRGCKLDYANLRFAELEYVSFEDCLLARADFQGARLDSVRVDGCDLGEADFTKATLARVDFRGSELAGLGGSLLGLRGAVVDSRQLIDLAPQLAAELGIQVEEA